MDIPAAVVEKILPKQPTLMNTSKQVVETKIASVVEVPKVEAKESDKVESPKVTSSDILKRTSVKTEEAPQENKDTNYREDLEKIQDPAVSYILVHFFCPLGAFVRLCLCGLYLRWVIWFKPSLLHVRIVITSRVILFSKLRVVMRLKLGGFCSRKRPRILLNYDKH